MKITRFSPFFEGGEKWEKWKEWSGGTLGSSPTAVAKKVSVHFLSLFCAYIGAKGLFCVLFQSVPNQELPHILHDLWKSVPFYGPPYFFKGEHVRAKR